MASTSGQRQRLSAYAIHYRNSLNKQLDENCEMDTPRSVKKRQQLDESPEMDTPRRVKQTKVRIEKNSLNVSPVDAKSPRRKRKPDAYEIENGELEYESANIGKLMQRSKKIKVHAGEPLVTDFVSEVDTERFNKTENGINGTVNGVLNSPTRQKPALCGNTAAEESFKWLLKPTDPAMFYEKIFEKKPFHISRCTANYYEGLFSSEDFDTILKENSLSYDKEIDVLTYADGERRPVVNEMKVFSSFIWNAYQCGNSIRMRNPQAYHKKLWMFCSLLQEYFSSVVGVNMYLTPAGTQGFPPHWDDIDAFVLQIEGSKFWKLYQPSENLARYSSGDLKEDEIGSPIFEAEVKAGDLLYFPRGYIHEARAMNDVHSLHLTISANQLNTWGDLLQLGFTYAVEQAMKNDVEFRKALPKDYTDYAGAAYYDSHSKERIAFERKFCDLAQKTLTHLSINQAVDMHAADFIHGSMPPFFNKEEKATSIHGHGNRLENGRVIMISGLNLQTKIRFIRKRNFRLVLDDSGARLFYCLGNSKNHKEEEAVFMEMDLDVVPAINILFRTYPNYIKVEDLPLASKDTKVELAQQLYDSGFLMTKEPLFLDQLE